VQGRLGLWLLAQRAGKVRIFIRVVSSFEFQVSPEADKSAAGNENWGIETGGRDSKESGFLP
jgi:hypothetical protein